jgi:hypothetical protein
MEEQTPILDPNELYNKRRSKDASRLKAYNKILEQIYNRIRVISRLPNSQCYLLYTVPPFIIGLPKIDIEDCVVYLMYQLRHAGYETRYTYPNLIYISWMHHEKNYIVEQSPIMQAMLESAERTAAEKERKEREAARLLGSIGRKSSRKVKFQTPGSLSSPQTNQLKSALKTPSREAINNVLNIGPSRNQQNISVGPPPPSAAEYIPPPTFLQSMSNPQNTVEYPKSIPEYFKL